MKRTVVFLLSAFVVACGPTKPEGPHFLWEADAGSTHNPFPDARVKNALGQPSLRPDWFRPFLMSKALTSDMKTFLAAYTPVFEREVQSIGAFGPTLLRPSVPVDQASLPGHFARVKVSGESYTVLEPQVPVEHSTTPLKAAMRDIPSGYPEFVMARPSIPLLLGETGYLVVTRGIKTATGEDFVVGAEWDKATPKALKEALATALGLKPADILLALPQAGLVSNPLPALLEFAKSSGQVPVVKVPAHAVVDSRPVGEWKSSDGDWSYLGTWFEKWPWAKPADKVGRVVIGTLRLRDLREGGVWKPEWVQAPATAPLIDVPFIATFPKGAPPSGGKWPLIIAAHGIAGRNVPQSGDGNGLCLEVAQLFSQRGFACLGIDAPQHGTRGNFFDFFKVENVAIIRDNFREMSFDLMQLATAAQTMDLDNDGQPDFKPDLSVMGNSLGSIMAASWVSMDDRVKTSVLNVPGGGLSNILVSDRIRDQVGLILAAATSVPYETPEYYNLFPAFRAVAQPILEATDPINVTQGWPSTRAVLIQEALGDETVPNFTTEDLANHLSVPAQDVPLQTSGPQRVLWRINVGKASYNPHDVFWEATSPRTQTMDFIESDGKNLTGTPL